MLPAVDCQELMSCCIQATSAANGEENISSCAIASRIAASMCFLEATFQKVRAYDQSGTKNLCLRRPDGRGGWIKGGVATSLT